MVPFMRSDAQGRVLAQVLLGQEQTLSDVSSATGVPLTTVQREADRLADAGAFLDRKVGPARLVRANPDYPLLAPLTQIVAATWGPFVVLADSFADLPGIERLMLFGSWAERMAGTPGPFPRDIDVLVIGDVRNRDAYMRAARASRTIGRELNVTTMTRERWEHGDDGFVTEVRAHPVFEVEVHDAA